MKIETIWKHWGNTFVVDDNWPGFNGEEQVTRSSMFAKLAETASQLLGEKI